VIQDVDLSLRAWLARCLPEGTEVRFGRPPERQPGGPLVHGFLFDIREDIASLTGYAEDIRGTDGAVVGRRQPIRRYRLRYLLTAWVQDDAEPTEHELLGAILLAGAEDATIPADCLAGSLAGTDQVVPLRCAPDDARPAGVDQLTRTALELLVIAPLIPVTRTELAPPPGEFHLRPVPSAAPSTGGRPTRSDRRPRGRITEAP
jgi:hypothetical protein